MLGAVLAAGMWNRITFPAYFLPIPVLLLHDAWCDGGHQLISRFRSVVLALGTSFLGWVVTAYGLILVDSAYFGYLKIIQTARLHKVSTSGAQEVVIELPWYHLPRSFFESGLGRVGDYVVPPIHNLLYNVKTENLAQHGLSLTSKRQPKLNLKPESSL